MNIVEGLAPGSSPEVKFDNSRFFFHPNDAGQAVMACDLEAALGAPSLTLGLGGPPPPSYPNAIFLPPSVEAACRPSGQPLVYMLAGLSLSTTTPVPLVPGGAVPFTFNGFDPGSNVDVQLNSQGYDLGTFTADATGTVSGDITVPVGIQPGVHQLVFSGTNNQSPRSIQVLVQVAGRPKGGQGYGTYLSGFAPGEGVEVNYGGLDLGTSYADQDGGLFLQVPLPAPAAPGSIGLTATGQTSGVTVTEQIAPAPLDAAAWASGGSARLSIVGSGIKVTGWAHSDGSVSVSGQGLSLTGGLEYGTTYSEDGSGDSVSPAPVQVAPGGQPFQVDVAEYAPGSPTALALGSAYYAVPASACVDGVWSTSNLAVTASVVYVPCAVDLDTNGPLDISIAATGPISVTGNGAHLEGTAVPFSLASASSGRDAIDVTGSGFSADYPVVGLGGISLDGHGAKLNCGAYGGSISVTASGTALDACQPTT